MKTGHVLIYVSECALMSMHRTIAGLLFRFDEFPVISTQERFVGIQLHATGRACVGEVLIFIS